VTALNQLSVQVRTRRRILDQQVGELRAIALEGKRAVAEGQSLAAQRDLLDQAMLLLSTIGEERQAVAQLQIEGLVTHALKTIFGDDLSFHVVTGSRGKQSTTDFVVRSVLGGTTVDTPVLDARGGGLAAVVGFLLRLVVLLLTKSQAQVLFLDESFAMVSAEYQPALSEFLQELVARTDIQLLMVTHQPALMEGADKVYRFQLKDGLTEVTEVA
jgi:ABC-type iron transport system FetAB ATPase subunit